MSVFFCEKMKFEERIVEYFFSFRGERPEVVSTFCEVERAVACVDKTGDAKRVWYTGSSISTDA